MITRRQFDPGSAGVGTIRNDRSKRDMDEYKFGKLFGLNAYEPYEDVIG
jgi:hypothetical protein